MAQLVKLHNYISRYERNIYHYPGRFIHLKKEKWKKTNMEWNQPTPLQSSETHPPQSKWKNLWGKVKKEKKGSEEVTEELLPVLLTNKEKRQVFLDALFPFQLKWASSTISQMSFLDEDFKKDESLKYFLQRFPDTYLVFYHPVFTLKNSTMETDILLVGPYEIDIIKIMDNYQDGTFTVTNERTWEYDVNGVKRRVINPLLSLNRTERVIKSILKLYGNNFSIRKSVISRRNAILSSYSLYNTDYIDAQNHDAWLEKKREGAHLLKHRQLQVCEQLLTHCDSVAFQRPEWDQDKEFIEEELTHIPLK